MTNDLMSVFDIFNNKHNFIGFTDFFDDLYNFDKKFKNNSFPPYNIFTKEVNVCNNNDKAPIKSKGKRTKKLCLIACKKMFLSNFFFDK